MSDEIKMAKVTTDPVRIMRVSGNGQSIADLAADVAQLQDDVGGIQDDVGEIQDDVGGIQDDVGEIQDDVAGIQADVTQLQTDVSGVSSTVSGMASDVTEIAADVSDLKSNVQALPKIQYGSQASTTTVAEHANLNVVFDTPFSSAHKVFLTSRGTESQGNCAFLREVTTTGFSAIVCKVASNAFQPIGNASVNWLAIGT